MPTAQDVADFLGRGQDNTVLALAGEHVAIVTAMARAYTRGKGFDENGDPLDDVAAVIVTATARLMANPDQIARTTGPFSYSGGFTGWSLAETFVLNRYRKRSL
jgi:hypothetical protein